MSALLEIDEDEKRLSRQSPHKTHPAYYMIITASS